MRRGHYAIDFAARTGSTPEENLACPSLAHRRRRCRTGQARGYNPPARVQSPDTRLLASVTLDLT
jgi:hypothetical protein